MKKTVFLLWIVGIIVAEGLRLIFGIERLANEIQILSAIPWIPMGFHMWKLHEKHTQIEKHLREGRKHE